MRISTSARRCGASMVEAAVVYPVWFILLFGILQGGVMIFTYQEVAWLSREVTRRASVCGSQYATETGNASPTKANLRQNVVLPLVAAMNPSQLTVQVFLVDGSTGAVTDWDSSSKAVSATQGNGTVANRVRVQVTYVWTSLILATGPITLQSTSEVPMSY